MSHKYVGRVRRGLGKGNSGKLGGRGKHRGRKVWRRRGGGAGRRPEGPGSRTGTAEPEPPLR